MCNKKYHPFFLTLCYQMCMVFKSCNIVKNFEKNCQSVEVTEGLWHLYCASEYNIASIVNIHNFLI